MLLVYCKKITPRIRYAFDLMLKQLFGLDYRLTDDKQYFLSSSEPKISYGEQSLEGELFFKADELLFQSDVKEQKPEMALYHQVPVLFPVTGGVLPFDPFAGAFYLVSRYEEYLPFQADEHGRFPAEESIAFKKDFLQTPVVDLWAQEVKHVLLKHFPHLSFPSQQYQFIPTYDVDMAFAFKARNLKRTAGGLARQLLNFDLGGIIERLRVLYGKKEDPYDVFEFLAGLHQKFNLDPLYFFLLGDYGRWDKNISVENPELQQVIKETAATADIGIHPSYDSHQSLGQLEKEKQRLEGMSGKNITKSRQHYLKFTLPETYQRLIKAGIKEDYTMGYASHPGFRAGACSPFYFYDLQKEQQTELLCFPLALMDGSLKHHLKLSLEEAKALSFRIIDDTKKVNGTFITLWHNNSFYDKEGWGGWKTFYEELLAYAK